MTKLEQVANNIPSMVSTECKKLIRECAKKIKGGNIVEVGTWLGACTAQICLGLNDANSDATIYCYDYFECNSKKQAAKAINQGVQLEKGQDYYDLFYKNVNPFGKKIIAKKGNNKEIVWDKSKKIAMYVDDASKKHGAFDHMVKTFFPALLPGASVILLDYFYFETKPNQGYDYQYNWMQKHKKHFYFVRRVENQANAFFIYKGGL